MSEPAEVLGWLLLWCVSGFLAFLFLAVSRTNGGAQRALEGGFACWRMAISPALLHMRMQESLELSDAALQSSADWRNGTGEAGDTAMHVK